MDRGTLIRTIALGIALINQLLIQFDLEPVPGSQEHWYDVISTVLTIAVSIIAWFRNNYVTIKGKRQLKVLQREGLTDVEKVS